MPIDALPPRLQENLFPHGDGTDGDNAAQQYHSRAWTAFGPRVEKQRWTWARIGIPYTRFSVPVCPVLAKWRLFPKLLIGYNVARWMAMDDWSVIFVGRFVSKMFWPWTSLYQLPVIEMQPDNQKYGESLTAMVRGRLWDTIEKNYFIAYAYGPSPIQKFAFGWSWQLTWPLNGVISYRRKIGPNDKFWQWLGKITKQKNEAEFVWFFRFGGRWDSKDMYYVFLSAAFGFDWN